MKEKLCPICTKPVRSDASAKRYCKLCGMFIDDTEHQFIYVAEKDVELHFCCEECMKRYVGTFNPVKIGEKMVTVEDIIEDITVVQEGEEISILYSKSVEEVTYLPTAQVSK
jgi:hypothetical protein